MLSGTTCGGGAGQERSIAIVSKVVLAISLMFMLAPASAQGPVDVVLAYGLEEI